MPSASGTAIAKSSVAKVIHAFERRPHLKAVLEFTGIAVRTFNREFQQKFQKAYQSKGLAEDERMVISFAGHWGP